MPTTSRVFHLDLRHLPSVDGLVLECQGRQVPLTPHSAETRGQLGASFAALPAEQLARFGHFAALDAELFPEDAVRWVRVVRPAPAGQLLPTVVLIAQVLPEGHLLAHAERMIRRAATSQHPRWRGKPAGSGKLSSLGLRQRPAEAKALGQLMFQAQHLMTTLDTAAAFVSHHPDLANVQPSTAAAVMNDYILPDADTDPAQYNAMQVLAGAVGKAGDRWSPVVDCKDQHGNLLQAQYTLGTIQAGQQLQTYDVEPNVLATSVPASNGARKGAQDDMFLRNKLWSPTPGTTVLAQSGAAPTGLRDASYTWTVQEQTSMSGVSVDAGSIAIDGSNFSVNANNSYLRTLYVSYQLYDDAGNPIGDETLLTSVSATNTIMGIPVSTDPTQLAFDMQGASSVTLYFGSLGTSNWHGDASTYGALLTGLWQYGIPGVFLVAGAALSSTSWFNKLVNNKALRDAAITLLVNLVGNGAQAVAALENVKTLMISFADTALSIVVQKGMEELGTWLTEQVGAGELASAFGPIGWILKLVSSGLDFEEMAVTTGEVLSSSACIEVTVTRSLDVSLTLGPDPRHGAAGNSGSAVWPSVGQSYVVMLDYQDGTNFKLTGTLPATTSGTPLQLTYTDVPAGGQFRIIAGIYSASGWLCGTYQSDWTAAVPNQGSTLVLPAATITELLVPLAGDAQYTFKERVGYGGGSFGWVGGGSPPSATVANLNCGDGGTLCELVDITINNSAFQVGYAWRASGQNLSPDSATAPASNTQLYALQSLSVLASPGQTLIASDIGLTDMPAIGYAPSYNATNEIDQDNFVVDPRNGGMNLRKVTLTATGPASTFGLGEANLPSWGSFPLTNVDALAIHPNSTAIACSWQDSKLMVLPLPAAAATDGQAPVAVMVSGEGIRQGLTQGPKAMAVAPDGRLLVLETTNQRVQAFDNLGNAVPSFTPYGLAFTMATADVAAALDTGTLAPAFTAALAATQSTLACMLDGSFIPELDGGTFSPTNDPLILALSQNGILLAYNPQAMQDATQSAQITVLQAGQAWLITDPRGMQWQVQNAQGLLAVVELPAPGQTTVEVLTAGQSWLIVDAFTGNAWKLIPSTADPTQTEAYVCVSFFPLTPPPGGTPTYLDLAVESQGYVYVLSYGGDGTAAADYYLDVYGPDGSLVFRTPDPALTTTPQNVAAAHLAVDIWRNVYALTYETLTGPNGDPQPGLAHWIPTPPLATLPLTAQPDLNQGNITAVVADFAAVNIQLSSQAFITTQNPDGAWTVKDGTTLYNVYRSGDGLQVYGIPA